jgi:hypothetical protein
MVHVLHSLAQLATRRGDQHAVDQSLSQIKQILARDHSSSEVTAHLNNLRENLTKGGIPLSITK